MRLAYALVVPILVLPALAEAPEAIADCTSVGGTTLCSQGTSRGADTGNGPSGSGPYVPYPCEWGNYACDDWWDFDVDVDLDPGRPGRPDIGGPGGPGRPGIGGPGGGNRPGGGRPGGGRGGGGRR